MIIYGNYKANSSCIIDFMEFEFKEVPNKFVPEDFDTNKDLILTVDWDESDWGYDEKTKEGFFRVKGVYINQIYANGMIDLFKDAILDTMQIYGQHDAEFQLTSIEIEDNNKVLEFAKKQLTPRDMWYEED